MLMHADAQAERIQARLRVSASRLIEDITRWRRLDRNVPNSDIGDSSEWVCFTADSRPPMVGTDSGW